MKKAEFIAMVAKNIRATGAHKEVHIPSHKFTIIDEDDNEASFTVSSRDRRVLYSQDDVKVIFEAIMESIQDVVRSGDAIRLPGVGIVGIRITNPRNTHAPGSDQTVKMGRRVYPKFTPSINLRRAAMLYGIENGIEGS